MIFLLRHVTLVAIKNEDIIMLKDLAKSNSIVDESGATLIFLFCLYVISSILTNLFAVFYFKGDAISSNFMWNVVMANVILVVTLFVIPVISLKAKIVALFIFFIINGFFGTYKQSTIHYYMNTSYQSPEYYPKNSNQHKIVTDIIAHKDLAFKGNHEWLYFKKADLDKLGNMTNFFITYGQRNEQMKLYEAQFKALLNTPFLSAWDYLQFENEVISYLSGSNNSLQKNETVSMLYTIKLGV